ncbi:MAG: DUF288 domain-containing protein [Sedimentisphaerales bacterium]|nr:DUF288 domain-containing protein [Sedimentisphaerales bacterium]
MEENIFLVVTSISGTNEALSALAKGCKKHNWRFILIGDESSPDDFTLDGCDFYSLKRQKALDFKFPNDCPTKHYARKNIGYLLAVAEGFSVIIETDDDNLPYDSFWQNRIRQQQRPVLKDGGWINVYGYFSDENIWPRGFALEELQKQAPQFDSLQVQSVDCPIQQNLANENPDVDAVYRLTMPLPVNFKGGRKIALGAGSICPFNSQNTTWFPQAYKLMYLPAYCSFRMTDIWRSFIAQQIAYTNGWHILFDEPTMYQERNVHNLMKDFADEIPGYLNNKKICDELETLSLQSGEDKIDDNLNICYEKLIEMEVVGKKEMKLLDAWLKDINDLKQ